MKRRLGSLVMMAVLAASGGWAWGQTGSGAGGGAGPDQDKSAPLVIPDDSGAGSRRAFPDMPPEMRKMQEQMQALRMEGGPLNAEQVRKMQDQMAQRMQLQLAAGMGPNGLMPRVAAAEVRREKAAFLGVTTSAVTAILREQLKIDKGVGLVVDYVEKDSPADAAGIKVHDILTKLDDQVLINAQQLAVLVRSKKGGDAITLTLIHEGKTVTASAKLVEKDLPVLDEGNPWLVPDRKFFTVPGPGDAAGGPAPGAATWQKSQRVTVKAQADGSTVKTYSDGEKTITITTTADGKATLAEQNKQGKELFSGPINTDEEKLKVPNEVASDLQEMGGQLTVRAVRPEAEHRIGATPGGVRIESSDGSTLEANSITLSRADGEHVMTLSISGTGDKLAKTLVVKDAKTGKVIFEGPVNTEEQRKALPADVARKLEGLEAKAGK